jgi:hypothetical protein
MVLHAQIKIQEKTSHRHGQQYCFSSSVHMHTPACTPHEHIESFCMSAHHERDSHPILLRQKRSMPSYKVAGY